MSSLPSSSSGDGENVFTVPSSTYTAPSATSSTNPSSRILIRVEDNKLVPVGASSFPPGQAISTYMASKFDERQEATTYSGKHISLALREFYWEEFKKMYTWDSLDDEAIKSCWWQNVKIQYTKHIHSWRHSKNGKPGCVTQEIWDTWQQLWSSPDWKDKANKAKQSRLTETGGPGTGVTKHTCGSRSMVEHSLKMTEELKRRPNSWELFKKVHTKKDGTFVDARSKQVNDRMEELVSSASQPLDEGSEPLPIDIDALYFEAAGGEKKRRIYGLGSWAASFQSSRTLCSSQVAVQVKELAEKQQELEEKQVEMDKKIAELNAQTERLHQMEEQMRRFMEHMEFAREFHGSRSSTS